MKLSQWILYSGNEQSAVINGYSVARDNAIRISYAHDIRVDIADAHTGEIVASYYGGLKVEG